MCIRDSTSAKPADGKKGQEAPKAPADTPAKPTNEKKGQEEPKAPTDTSAKPCLLYTSS